MAEYVNAATAARLTGRAERTIQNDIATGKLEAALVETADGGGLAGTAYRIPVDALPAAAQIRYWEEVGHQTVSRSGVTEALDLGAYKRRAGEAGMAQLLRRQQAVLRCIGLKTALGRGGLTQAVDALAAEYGMSGATLRRLTERYEAEGLTGLTRRGRADAGESRCMCLEARRLICCWDLDCNKLKGNTILDLVLDRARELGADGCRACPYNPESDNHEALMESEDAAYFPACDKAGHGIIPPENRHAVNRVIAAISDEERCYMREGRKPWEAAYMTKAVRAKPEMVNECWFGDHHQFDLFCLDSRGRPVRPWLTAWYDIGSGMMVGWCISLNPNSATIAEAYLNAVAEKPNSPVYGAPRTLYMDNGKDYRSRAFAGEADAAEYWRSRDPEMLDDMYARLTGDGILRLMHVETVHAKAYHGWAKPIERFFRTLEERYCRQLKGYCGGKPADRAENFDRSLKTWVERGELMTLDELADCWQNEILPAYHNHPHSGYNGETPAARYARLPKARSEIFSHAMLAELRKAEATRKVAPIGIKFAGRVYWDAELMHMAGQWVTVKYCEDCISESVSIYDGEGRYICEARVREAYAYVGEDDDKIAQHVSLQKRQETDVRQRIRGRGVRLPGKRASGNVYSEMTDGMSAGNITNMQAERAQRAQEAARAQAQADGDWSSADEYYYRKGMASLLNQG